MDDALPAVTREEVAHRWRAMLEGAESREAVHEWAETLLFADFATQPDPMTMSGLQWLHGADMTYCSDDGRLVGHGPPGPYVRSLEDLADQLATWQGECADHDANPARYHDDRRRVALDLLWAEQMPGCEPLPWDLKSMAADRWVRFHNLPGGKRYADAPDEYREVELRQSTVLQTLMAPTDPEGPLPRPHMLLAYTEFLGSPPSAGPGPHPVFQPFGQPFRWRDINRADEIAVRLWTWTIPSHLTDDLTTLLLAIAGDEVGGVWLAANDFRWMYHPYHGGIDVINRTRQARDQLRDTYSDWISHLPSGL